MGLLDAAFGTSLIGTWVASLLYGFALSQAFSYFYTFPSDSRMRKGLVASSLFLSFVGLIGAYADVYLATHGDLVGFAASLILQVRWLTTIYTGNVAAIRQEIWGVPVYTICNTMAGTVVNSYLITRFYHMSKNIVMTIILCAVVLLALVMAFVGTLLYPGLANIKKAETLGLIWAIACAVSDVSIATSLVWQLGALRTTFKQTNHLIRRVMISLIQNGCVTSLAAVAGLISAILRVDSNIATLFFFLLGPLYVLTLLSNFNLRALNNTSGSRTWSASRNNDNSNVRHAPGPAIQVTIDRSVSVMELTDREQQVGGIETQKHDSNTESFDADQIKVPGFVST
ncbi:hypothetical protein DFH07DRAFT_965929 [Mycena maculata]|uniref:DUF6534 domain-containing protein n=1 Tax=Mycena maculata TaxID=230809 RepID=A0AAD7IAN8_9AGAR|nr:hypothetical protein DFH07DRAFT_965929 [Mycena maculata]